MLPPNTHALSGLYPCCDKVEAFLFSIGIVFDPIWIFHSKSIFRFFIALPQYWAIFTERY